MHTSSSLPVAYTTQSQLCWTETASTYVTTRLVETSEGIFRILAFYFQDLVPQKPLRGMEKVVVCFVIRGRWGHNCEPCDF